MINWKGFGRKFYSKMEALSTSFPSGTMKIHGKPQSEQPMSWPKFETEHLHDTPTALPLQPSSLRQLEK